MHLPFETQQEEMCSVHPLTYLALPLRLGLHTQIDRIGVLWDSMRGKPFLAYKTP